MTRSGRLGLILLGLVAAFAIIGPLVSPDPMIADNLAHGSFLAPTQLHWLGTDQFSRDIMARLARGARTSLEVAVLAVAVAAAIGSALGLAAASAGPGGRLLQRVIDLGLAIPRIIVLLVVLAALGRVPPPVLGLLLGATGWPAIARLVRGEALRIRQAQFITAARALGARARRIVWLEIFPGTVPAVLVAATLGAGRRDPARSGVVVHGRRRGAAGTLVGRNDQRRPALPRLGSVAAHRTMRGLGGCHVCGDIAGRRTPALPATRHAMTPLLEVSNLHITIAQDGAPPLVPVDDVTFSVSRGELVALVGESGCGKTLTGLSLPRLLPRGAEIGAATSIRLPAEPN